MSSTLLVVCATAPERDAAARLLPAATAARCRGVRSRRRRPAPRAQRRPEPSTCSSAGSGWPPRPRRRPRRWPAVLTTWSSVPASPAGSHRLPSARPSSPPRSCRPTSAPRTGRSSCRCPRSGSGQERHELDPALVTALVDPSPLGRGSVTGPCSRCPPSPARLRPQRPDWPGARTRRPRPWKAPVSWPRRRCTASPSPRFARSATRSGRATAPLGGSGRRCPRSARLSPPSPRHLCRSPPAWPPQPARPARWQQAADSPPGRSGRARLCRRALGMTALSLAFSSCPNDTFVFDAWVNGRLATGWTPVRAAGKWLGGRAAAGGRFRRSR